MVGSSLGLSRFSPSARGLTQIPQPNTFGIAGTSRLANVYLDPSKRNRGNASFLNWAGARLALTGKRPRIAAHTAVSGSRVDQFDIAGALAPRPACLLIDGPVNTFAQRFANASVTAALMQSYIVRALALGADVILVQEAGAAGLDQGQIGSVNDYNARMEDWCAGRAGVRIFDPRPSAFLTGQAGAIAYKTGLSLDGTHTAVPGGQAQGAAFADFLAPLLVAIPGDAPGQGTEARGFGSAQLLANPLFFTGSGGNNNQDGTGNTGTLPGACYGFARGGATSTFSVQTTTADAQGNTYGNEVKIAASASAAAGQTGFYWNLNAADPANGDVLRFGCEIAVAAGATGLRGVTASLEMYPSGGQSMVLQDMAVTGLGTDAGGYTIALAPADLVIPAADVATGPFYINLNVVVDLTSGGSATVTVRKPMARRVYG